MELIKQLKAGTSPLDIIHGELKVLMIETQEQLLDLEADESSLPYLEGVLDAYTKLYKLTYDISFAEADLTKSLTFDTLKENTKGE